MVHIAILVPVCSRNQSYKTLESIPFINILYPSFVKFKDQNYEYSFYIGYDSTDEFYKQVIHDLPFTMKDGSNIKLVELKGCEHKPARAWNILFQNALSDNCDYFYQIGDDVRIKSPWTEVFIDTLNNNNNIGVVGACHLKNYNQRVNHGRPPVIENAFVHKTHYDIFKTFFDERIDNWFCDDWITEVYKVQNSSFHLNNVFVENLIIDTRYTIKNINSDIHKYISEGRGVVNVFIIFVNLLREMNKRYADVELWS